MSDEQHQNNELKMDVCLIPSLESAAKTWHTARHRYQVERMTQQQDAYNKATDELGQAFSHWKAEQPKLFEQFRLWLDAHPED